MTREESLKLAQYEETPYYFQRLINKIYDDFENKYKQDEKDLQTMKILFDSEFCRCSNCGSLKRRGFGCICEND